MLDNDYDDEDGEREGSRMQTKLKSSQMKKFNNYQTKPPTYTPAQTQKCVWAVGATAEEQPSHKERERERLREAS